MAEIKSPQTPANETFHKPSWWTDKVDASWNKVKSEVLADWKKVVGAEKKVEHGIDEQAVAFGHGARQAFGQIKTWGKDLEAQLKADWQQTTMNVEGTWEKMSAAIKHGWERAVGSPPPPPRSETKPSATGSAK